MLPVISNIGSSDTKSHLNKNSDTACYKSYFLIHNACFMHPDLMTLYVEICILRYFLAEVLSHSSKQMVSQQQTEI